MADPPVVRWWDFDRDAELTCPRCGWRGTSWLAEMELPDDYEERVDCPRCREVLLLVTEPTDEETKAAAAAGNAQAAKSLYWAERIDAAETLEEESSLARQALWSYGLAPDDLAKAPTPLVCAECGREDSSGPGWKMERAELNDVVAYCPQCWARKFGESASDA